VKNNVAIFFIKLLISIIITLIILILIKASSNFKTNFYKHVYNTNISFAPLTNLYNKYIGDLDILDGFVNTQTVFNEKLSYNNTEKYLDGVKVKVNNNLVPINESGIVVFIGEKDGYGNTVIVQRIDGVDEWYGNIINTNVKLYDYVEKGSLLGEVKDYLYLVYKKDGNILNYEEYLK
jgi:stage IV sporulation protein FA